MPIDPQIYPSVRQQIIDAVIERIGTSGIVPDVVDVFRNGEDDFAGKYSKVGATQGKGIVVVLIEGDDEPSPLAEQNNTFEEFVFMLDVLQLLDDEIAVANNLTVNQLAQYRHALIVNAATAIVTDGKNDIVEYRSKWNNLAIDTTVMGGGALGLHPMPMNDGFVLGVVTSLRIRYRHAYGRPGVVV